MSTKSENVVDDWEGIDDTELNTKLDQLKKNATNNSKISAGFESSRPFNAMLLSDDECLRTQYAPPEPTVKILKRPTNDKNNQQLLAETRPKAPIKTLQQREQEYAEARLRILGSAKSAEEEEQEQASVIVNRNGTSNVEATNGFHDRSFTVRNAVNNTSPLSNSIKPFSRNYSPQQLQLQQQLQQCPSQILPEMRRIDDNVIRLPRGPDGTAGFMLKR